VIWLRWTALSAVGYALGTTVSVGLLGSIARPLGQIAGGMLFLLAFGWVFGVAIAIPPLLGSPRGAVRRGEWIAFTTVGASIGFALAAVVGERLADVVSPTGSIIVGGGTIQILSGATLGLATGVAQSRALDRSLGIGRWWILASTAGTGLGYGAAAGVLELLDVRILHENLIPSFGAIVGLLVGMTQGLVMLGQTAVRSSERLRGRPRPD
jgi:hypothetical protein